MDTFGPLSRRNGWDDVSKKNAVAIVKNEANVIYGTDFQHKLKPKSKKQQEIERLAVEAFYKAIGKEPPKELA